MKVSPTMMKARTSLELTSLANSHQETYTPPSTPRWPSIAVLIALFAFLLVPTGTAQAQTATSAPITGEIERLTLANPNDVWSGGSIVVGRQNIIIPRNLLMDFPAN